MLVNGMTGYLDAEFRALHALGHELLVVAPGSPDLAVGAMADTAFAGLETESYADVLSWTEQPEPDALVARVREFGPDAVIMWSWNFSPAYRAVMKAVPGRVARGMVMDNLWRATPRQWLGRLTHRWYVDPVADFVLVPSDRTEWFARRLGFAAADVVRGSITADTTLFTSPPRDGDELAGRRSFLHVGRLVDHKGADLLAAAYERYRALADDPWSLEVVGMGPMEPLLSRIDGVTLHGFVQPSDVAALMREVSCFVLPSHIEPYGAVLHEAAASALPIVTTEFAGAMPVMVQDGQNGWVVPSGDVEAMAHAMRRMGAASSERLGGMSRISRALSERLSPAGWAQHLAEDLERRIAAGGGRLG